MSLAKSGGPGSRSKVWDRFLESLHAQGIKQKQIPWYARRVEQYLRSFDDKLPDQHTGEDVTRYLEALGRKDRLRDWQYWQIVEVLRVYFDKALQVVWARAVAVSTHGLCLQRLIPRQQNIEQVVLEADVAGQAVV